MKSIFLNELKWRGLINDITPHTESSFNEDELIAGYIGFDPTAPSLHVGNLCAIMMLKHLQLAGHKPIILLGGFTGGIGDPAGKSSERKLLSNDIVHRNLNSLKHQFSKYLDFDCGANSAEFVDNNDWLSKLSLSDFLREVGKHITVNYMADKKSVQSRIATGLSFTEFTYQLFQAYDFYWLYENKNCKLQMGGSDQWGNITGGCELIRKKLGQEAFAITTELLTKSDGSKFGKSEEGNIWLDPILTSPYKFYQFWLNVEDSQIGKLLRVFTTFSKDEIENMEKLYVETPNVLKRILANFITSHVHSSVICEKVERASNLLFSNSTMLDFENTDDGILDDIFQELNYIEINHSDIVSITVEDIVSKTFDISKNEGRRLIKSNSISINRQRISPENTPKLPYFMLLKGKYLLLQKGKTFAVTKFVRV